MNGLPPGWATTTVGVVTTDVDTVDPRALPHLPFTYVDIGSIDNATQTIAQPKSILGQDAPSRARQSLRAGDTVFSTVRTYLRNIGYVELPLDGAVASTGFSVLRPAVGIQPRYLYYYSLTNRFVDDLSSQMRGTSYPAVVNSQVRDMPIPIPPSREQGRIVAAIEEEFSRLDAGVAALERARRNLKRMRSAVLETAIAGDTASTFSRVRFGDVLSEPLRNGHSARADVSGSVRIWTLTAVTAGDFGISNTKITSADPLRVRDLWVQPGDLLIERSNTRELVGTARLYKGPADLAIYPDLVIRARTRDDVLPEFAELVLQAPSTRRYFQSKAQGISGSMPKIDQGVIERLTFHLPSPEAQLTILRSTESQLSAIAIAERALTNASARNARLRAAILAAAFSGRLAPQDPTDEPARILLESIAAERASANGHTSSRNRAPRSKVTA